MDVRVLEARQQHAALEVDHVGGRADELAHVVVRSHRDDPAVSYRDGLRERPGRVDRVHGAVHEGEVCRCGHEDGGLPITSGESIPSPRAMLREPERGGDRCEAAGSS